MTRVRLFMVSLVAFAALALPQAAMGVGPQTVPRVLVTEGFETTSSANYVTSAYVGGWQDGTAAGFWGRSAVFTPHSGMSSLWCNGTNAAAVAARKYAKRSAGHVSFPLTMTADYYGAVASFYYRMPSLGDQEKVIPPFVPQYAPTPNPGYYETRANPAITTALGASFVVTLTPSKSAGELSLSRSAGEFRLQWQDQQEIDLPTAKIHTGEGASVDDVVIAGWKYGPVRSLGATTTSISTTLTWRRPWRSTAETSTEERAVSYRVWRAPAGNSAWTELTSDGARLANGALSYTDTSVADATAYIYAVQAWDPGTGTETGEYRTVNATTASVSLPLVAIATPVSGAVVTGTGPVVVSGTTSGRDGATVTSASVTVRRDDNLYYNGLTGSWTAAPARVIAAVVGGGWSADWTPVANDYKQRLYTITASATDSRGKTATTPARTMRVDSVPFVSPVATVSSPSADTTVVSSAAFTISGTAVVQTGLPAAQVAVRISRDGTTWWNGSAWTSTNTTVAAAVTGSTWSVNVTPPANHYATSSFTVTAIATDAHGLTGTLAIRAFKVDSVPFVPPTAFFVTPLTGEDMLGPGPYTLRGTASAQPNLPLTIVTLTIARDDGTWWNGSTWQATPFALAASGTTAWNYGWLPPANEYYDHHYLLTVTATDAHGLSGSSTPVDVRVNSTVPNPPDVAVIAPTGTADIVDSDVFTVSGTAAGRDGAMLTGVSVRIRRDNATWWNGSSWQATPVKLPATGMGTWSYDWQPPAEEYLIHTYTFYAYAADNRAQTGTSTAVSARLDSVPFTPPTTAVTTPVSGTTLVTTETVVRGVAAATAGLQIADVRVTIMAQHKTTAAKSWWNGAEWVASETSITPAGLSDWNCAFIPKPADNVRYAYTISSTATDQHGLSATSSGVIVDADTTGTDKPKVTITSPSSAPVGKRAEISIAGTSTSAVGTSVGAVDVVIRRDDGKYYDQVSGQFMTGTTGFARATGTSTWSLKVPIEADKSHVYTITAHATDDRVGNRVGIGSSAPVTVSVDNVGPRLVGAKRLGPRYVELRFNEPVSRATVQLADFRSRLRLNGSKLYWSRDGRSVRIATAPKQPLLAKYTVGLSQSKVIADRWGNTSTAMNEVTVHK